MVVVFPAMVVDIEDVGVGATGGAVNSPVVTSELPDNAEAPAPINWIVVDALPMIPLTPFPGVVGVAVAVAAGLEGTGMLVVE